MNIGMLWFDNDTTTDLAAKVRAAADYYRVKYGKAANLCFVHPSMLNEPLQTTEGIEVRTLHWVLPNHFWIGVNQNTSN